MKKTNSIKLNYIMNTLLTMSSVIFPLITFPYISRVLLPAGTGKVSFATSLVSYFSMFSQLGIPSYGIRAVARVRDDQEKLTKVTQELLILSLIMSAVTYVIFFVCLASVPRMEQDKALLIILSSQILLTAIGMEWFYQGMEQYTYITVRSLIFKVLALLFMFLLVRSSSDTLLYGAISIFAASASSILNFFHIRKYISLRPVGHYNFRPYLRPVLIFFSMSVATTVYTNLDTVMLGFMKTDTDVGYYNAAVKIKGVLVSVVTSLGTVLLPRCSYYVEQKKMKEFHEICGKAIHFVLLISLPVSFYFIWFARQSIQLLSGAAYMPAVLPMQILMPTLIWIGISNITGMQILVPTGREKTVLYSEIAGAVTDLILNFLLIPTLASTGAAIGTLTAEGVVVVYQVLTIRSEVSPYFRNVPWFKISAALMAAAVCSFWISALSIPPVITLIASAFLFFGVYVLLLWLMKEDLIRQLLQDLLLKVKQFSA